MSMFAACIVSDCFFASTFVSASVQAQLRRPVSSDLRLPSLLAVTVIDVFFPSRRVVGVSSVPPRRFFRDVVLAVSLLSSNPSFVLWCRSIPTFRSDPSLPPPSTSRASLPFHCRVLPRPLHLLLPSPPPTNAPWSASQAGAGARFGAPERVRSDCTRTDGRGTAGGGTSSARGREGRRVEGVDGEGRGKGGVGVEEPGGSVSDRIAPKGEGRNAAGGGSDDRVPWRIRVLPPPVSWTVPETAWTVDPSFPAGARRGERSTSPTFGSVREPNRVQPFHSKGGDRARMGTRTRTSPDRKGHGRKVASTLEPDEHGHPFATRKRRPPRA
eukprot:scaffold776_cov347-Pavlova_lutheri.AAC.123